MNFTSSCADESDTNSWPPQVCFYGRRASCGGQLFVMGIWHKPLPSSETLNEYFTYNPRSGILRWKKIGGWKYRPGNKAGIPQAFGYLVVSFKSTVYMAHRIIWCMVTGDDPGPLEIDHKNNNKSDNRWSNLRLATHANNNQNTKLQKNNSSGAKGVAWHKQRNCWRAYISVGPRTSSKQIHLGLFRTVEAAAEAVKVYRQSLHKQFTNHGT